MADLIQIEVQGQPRLEEIIHTIVEGLFLEKILDESAAAMFARERARFLLAEDPNNVPWIVSGAAIRRAHLGRGGATLYDSGRLFHSIQLFTAGTDSRAIGTDVPYGKFHQLGTIRLPVRQFLGFGDEDVRIAEGITLHRIIEAFQ